MNVTVRHKGDARDMERISDEHTAYRLHKEFVDIEIMLTVTEKKCYNSNPLHVANVFHQNSLA